MMCVPWGIRRWRRLWIQTSVVTMQLIGPAKVPLMRVVRTASMYVPSNTLWAGPLLALRALSSGPGRWPEVEVEAGLVAIGGVGVGASGGCELGANGGAWRPACCIGAETGCRAAGAGDVA